MTTNQTDLAGRPLRAAVVGVGYLGRFHAQKYKAIEGVDLVGVVDADSERSRRVAQELEVDFYSDLKDLTGKVDLVSVVTPTQSHFEIAGACLKAGWHVLVEKPITVTIPEADGLIALADQKKLVLQVGHLKRFHPAVVALNESGVLETPRFIESLRFAPFKSRALDVDVVLDLMIHDVDLILNFVGSEMVQVDAVGTRVVTNQVDIANARLKFANGCTANVTASRVARDSTRRIRLFQDNAFLSLDFIRNDIMVLQRGRGVQELDGIEVPAIEETTIPIQKYDTLEAEIRSFCEVVRDNKPPLVSGRDGRKALEVVNAIQESIEANTRNIGLEGMPGLT
ncbi:MAG: Gfo/Idh/MocA family oxidoreductase [Magnetococcales bacterium]|nr:Gfo/Idh/MocA family oxidoreductase [Magnetococcales bacterium]